MPHSIGDPRAANFKKAAEHPPLRPPEERGDDFKFIYALPVLGSPSLAKEQAGRCTDCGTVYCQTERVEGERALRGCPAGKNIPSWLEAYSNPHAPHEKNVQRAWRILDADGPLAEMTGYTCDAPCQTACTHSKDDPDNGVQIRAAELEIYLEARRLGLVQPKIPAVRWGMSVAVVGSGPAGLTAAYTLNQQGYDVTIFEAQNEVGGLLRFGIPDAKLPKDVLEYRIEMMHAEGIKFVTGYRVGASEAEDICARYDAVVLAVGAQKPRDLNIPGRQLSGITMALDLLTAGNNLVVTGDEGLRERFKGKVVGIVGSGFTAADVIGLLVRLGAKGVWTTQRSPEAPEVRDEAANPWPQQPAIKSRGETYAHEEATAKGILSATYTDRMPIEFVGEDGKVVGVKLAKIVRRNGSMVADEAM